MKLGKKLGLALLLVFIGMQFFSPEKNEDTSDHLSVFLTETNPPQEVRTLLQHACYDCHSNHTVYPWYNKIAPISFWLDHHVVEGKEHLNFSDWASYSIKKKDHKLEEVVEEVEEGKMPLDEYTWTHANARLTEDQKQQLMDWANKTRTLYQLGDQPE